MITRIAILLAVSCWPRAANATPQIDFVGNVVCEDTPGSVRPIAGVWVELANVASVPMTTSPGSGYYRVRASWTVYDSAVTLLFIAKRGVVARWSGFVSRSRLRRRDWKVVFTVEQITTDVPCSQIEPVYAETDIPLTAPRPIAGWEASGSMSALLFYTSFLTVGPHGIKVADFPQDSTITRVEYTKVPVVSATPSIRAIGNMRYDLRGVAFPSPGFRYAPVRDIAPAIATNASATALELGCAFSSDVSFRDSPSYSLHLSIPFHESWAIGLGTQLVLDRGQRTITDANGFNANGNYRFYELVWTTSIAKAIAPNLAVGFAMNARYGATDFPDYVERMATYGRYNGSPGEVVLDQSNEVPRRWNGKAAADADVSATWDALPSLRFGAAILNVADVAVLTNTAAHDSRTVGLGAAYSAGQVEFGGDVERARTTGWNASAGANVAVTSDVGVGVGVLTINRSMRWSVRLRSFMLSLAVSPGTWNAYLGSRVRF